MTSKPSRRVPVAQVPKDRLPSTKLLEQMDVMLQGFDEATGEHKGDVQADAAPSSYNLERCQSVLELYASASGPFEPILTKMLTYVFGQVEILQSLAARAAARTPPPTAPSKEAPNRVVDTNATLKQSLAIIETFARLESDLDGIETVSASDAGVAEHVAAKLEANVKSVDQIRSQMKDLVARSKEHNDSLRTTIAALEEEVNSLKAIIEFQTAKARRSRLRGGTNDFPSSENPIIVKNLDAERKLELALAEIEKLNSQNEHLQRIGQETKALNACYARQALEMIARVKIYSEQNEKLGTALAMQSEEQLALEKEHAALRADYAELSALKRTRQDGENDRVRLRPVRLGLGLNISVPKHLQHSGMVERIEITRDNARTTVADMFSLRVSGGSRQDFTVFLHHFLVKKLGNANAVSYAYALDDAATLFDADINFCIFLAMSRKQVSDDILTTVHSDTLLFLEACEMVDRMQHGEVRNHLHIGHVCALLCEMFPGVDEEDQQRLVRFVQTLTKDESILYSMLFPNRERSATLSADTQLREENAFSQAFKEMIFDDVMLTVQVAVDAIMLMPGEQVTINDVTNTLGKVFPSVALGMGVVDPILRAIAEATTMATGDFAVSKQSIVQIIRTRCLVRRNVHQQHVGSTSLPKPPWGWWSDEDLVDVNYSAVLSALPSRRTM